MTEETYYEYDQALYEAKLQELLQKSKKVRNDLKGSNYENLDALLKRQQKIQIELEDIINELEVEHFLMFGPQGEDPKPKRKKTSR